MIGTRIRKRREQLGYSQRALARKCKIDVVTLWRYEAGKMDPSVHLLARLARVLDVSIDWIVTGRRSVAA